MYGKQTNSKGTTSANMEFSAILAEEWDINIVKRLPRFQKVMEIVSAIDPVNQSLVRCCVNSSHIHTAIDRKIPYSFNTTDNKWRKNNDDLA